MSKPKAKRVKQVRSRRIVTTVNFSDRECDLDGFGCAYIEFDRELCDDLIRRAKMFMRCRADDHSLIEMYFWDSCDYYDLPDSLERRMGDREAIVVRQMPASLTKLEASRTECDQMIVRWTTAADAVQTFDVVEVCWTAIPKHCDVYATTASLRWDRLVEMLPEGWLPDWAQIMKEVQDEGSEPELPEQD